MATDATINGSADSSDQDDGATVDCGVESADLRLNVEVAQFLATEFFTSTNSDNGDTVGSSCRTCLNESTIEDDDFMSFAEPVDMPDLEFDHADGPRLGDFAQLREHDDTTNVNELVAAGTASDNLEPRSSLHALIPASALSVPPFINVNCPQKNNAKKTAPTLPLIKKARKRVKDEIEYLRQQVVDFEEKLEKLQLAPRKKVDPQTDSLSFQQGHFSSLSASWESVAKLQKEEMERSTAENAKLKEKLNKQLALAQSLSKFLENQHDVSWLETPSAGRAMKKLCIVPEHNESQFETLAAQVDELYTQLDAVLDESTRVGHESGVKSDANGNVYIEFVDINAVLFDYRITTRAMWKLMSTTSMNFGNRQYQTISATDDTVRARLSMTLRLHHEDMQIDMSFFGKRFVEADRVVIVWCTTSETQDGYLLVNGNERVQVRECGWTVIAAVHLAADADPKTIDLGRPQPGTIVQSIARLTPELERNEASSEIAKHSVGLLTDVVLSLYQQNLAALQQMIENTILSDVAEI